VPDYPKIVIPLNAGEPGWIRGGKMPTSEDEFKLDDPLQAALLLTLGLARREDLGALHIKRKDIERQGDGWLKFTRGKFDEPLTQLESFLEAQMEIQIGQHLNHKETLRFPLLQNKGNQWRVAWAPENVCFSPLAFRGALRLGEVHDGKRKGTLTIEMKVIENDYVKFDPKPLLVDAPMTHKVTEMLFFMNRNLKEMPAFAALADGVTAFCRQAYRLLSGKDPAEPQETLFHFLSQSTKGNLTEDDRQRLRRAQDKIRELADAHIAAERAKIAAITFSVEGFLTQYIASMDEIKALLVAKLSTDARDQIAWQKKATTVENIDQRVPNLHKEKDKLRDKFRNRLRKKIDLSAKGCEDFSSNEELLHYLIDFKIYADDTRVLPFHTERNRDHLLSLAPCRVLKAVEFAYTDAVERDDGADEITGEDLLSFQIEGEDRELWSELDKDIVCFENLLEEDRPLPESARLVIHPGGQRVCGVVVAG
jgi:hypothetical protein